MEHTVPLSVIIPVAIAWSGVLFGAIKWLVDRAFRSIDQRFKTIEDQQKASNRRLAELEKEFRDLLAALPLAYVQREDWIRFATSIDAKMDRMFEHFIALKNDLTKR